MVAVGEAAELQVLLTLKDQLSPALATTQARITELQGAGGLGGLSGLASKVESAFGGVGNALSHAASQIGGLVKNIGLFGGAIGLFSAAGAIKGAIDTANQMAKAIETLGPLTGDTAEQVSSLLAVFEKYGIASDAAVTHIQFMEKAIGLLSVNAKTAATFTKEFGFSITDASGKVLDANTILGKAADYWLSDASTAQKAALESKLFGRSFADMIPILNLGSKGIQDAEAAAQSLGLTLNAQNVTDLKNYQEAWRNFGETMSGLELQISLALVPALTDLASNLTHFVATNKGQIIGFFQDAAKFAEQMGSVIEHDVVPAIKAIVGWWNGLPGPLKDFLVTAFVAGKVSKFLFDVNIPGALLTWGVKQAASIVAGLAGDVLRYAFGGATLAAGVQAGATTGAGTIGGAMAAGGTAAAGEIEAAMATGGLTAGGELEASIAAAGLNFAGLLGKVLKIALPATAVAVAVSESQKFLNPARNPITGQIDHPEWALNGGVTNPIGAYGAPGFFGGNPSPSMIAAASQGVAGGTGGNVGQDQYGNVAGAANSLADALKNATTWAGNWTSALQKSEQIANKNFLHGKDVGSSADTITAYFQSLSSGYFDPSKTGIGNLTKEITRFKDEAVTEAKHGNMTLADKLNADAAKLQAIKDKLTATNSDLSAANAKLAKIAAKQTSFTQYLSIQTEVSARSVATQVYRSNLWGRVLAE